MLHRSIDNQRALPGFILRQFITMDEYRFEANHPTRMIDRKQVPFLDCWFVQLSPLKEIGGIRHGSQEHVISFSRRLP